MSTVKDVSMLQFVRVDRSCKTSPETSLCHVYKVEQLLVSFKVGQPLIYSKVRSVIAKCQGRYLYKIREASYV